MTESTAAGRLFQKTFWKHRAEHDVASSKIQSASRKTRAYPNGEDEAWWLDHGPGMVDSYVRWREKFGWRIWTTPDDRPAIELELLANVGIDLPVKMIIDRVFVSKGMTATENELIIVDLKSGARSPVSDLQLGVYRLGILETWGVNIPWGAYFDARKGELSSPFSLKRFSPALMCHWFRQYYDAHRQGLFIPNLSSYCRSCGVRDYCAAYGGSNAHFDPDYRFIVEENK